MHRSVLYLLVILGLSFAALFPAQTRPASESNRAAGLIVSQRTPPPGQATVIVRFKEQARLDSLGRNVVVGLQRLAQRSQGQVLDYLDQARQAGAVSQVIPLWIFNGLSVTAAPQVIAGLAAFAEVESIRPETVLSGPPTLQPGLAGAEPPEANIDLINAPDIWLEGYQGQGIVVASLDTGVDVLHPDLFPQWRGGSNSWYDPYGEHLTPYDPSGHGTAVMGVLLGGKAGGSAIGVAPQAQWIAAKIFDDQGDATETAVHLAFQWLLDPDGNPATPDSPQVVNNSWTYNGPVCDLSYQTDLQVLRAAGIVPVFAAGNFGPNPNTSASPANYPDALAVGATDINDLIYTDSSRGPSACGEPSAIYPELVAPGVDIRSADLYGAFSTNSGTSLAAPHVSGALALLKSIYPDLPDDDLAQALLQSSLDLGSAGADNDFGYGRIDVWAAYQWLITQHGAPPPTRTPTITPTITPSPTSTPTATPTPTLTPQPASEHRLFIPQVAFRRFLVYRSIFPIVFFEAAPLSRRADWPK